MAKSKKSKKKNSSVNTWLIVAGVGGVALIFFCVIGMALLLPAVQQAREAARRAQAQQGNPGVPGGQTSASPNASGNPAENYQTTMNNLKQIGLAGHNFHNTDLHFPPRRLVPEPLAGPFGEVPQSWMTDLLPYLDQKALYDSIKLGAVWTDPSQGNAFKTAVPVFLNPALSSAKNEAGYALSHYAANSRVISDTKQTSFQQMTDGTSNTMLAGTVTDGFRPWGDLANHRDGALGFAGGSGAFGAPFNGTALVLLADGSVKAIKSAISLPVCQKLADPADGQPLDLDIEAP